MLRQEKLTAFWWIQVCLISWQKATATGFPWMCAGREPTTELYRSPLQEMEKRLMNVMYWR